MNILDVKSEVIRTQLDSSPDRMRLVFDKCKELQEEYKKIYDENGEMLSLDSVNIDTVQGQLELKQMIWNVVEELYELANSFKNRPWTKTHYDVDKNRLMDELADSSIFFIHLVRKLGLDSEKYTELLLKKIEVNKFRIRSRY